MATLHLHHMYRIAHTVNIPALKGKAVVLTRQPRVIVTGDIARALVRVVNDDGTLGQEYAVQRGMIVQL